MIYRIRIDLSFTAYDPLNDLLEEARRRLPQAVTVKPTLSEEEPGTIRVEQCFHDEHPPKPCIVLIEESTAP